MTDRDRDPVAIGRLARSSIRGSVGRLEPYSATGYLAASIGMDPTMSMPGTRSSQRWNNLQGIDHRFSSAAKRFDSSPMNPLGLVNFSLTLRGKSFTTPPRNSRSTGAHPAVWRLSQRHCLASKHSWWIAACTAGLLHHGIASVGSSAPRTSFRRAKRTSCMRRLASTLHAWL
jgi:hypothetical protein